MRLRKFIAFCLAFFVAVGAVSFTLTSGKVYQTKEMSALNANYAVGPYDAPSYGQIFESQVVDVGLGYLGGILLDQSGNAYTWGWNGWSQIGVGKDDGHLPLKGADASKISDTAWKYLSYSGGLSHLDFFTNPENYDNNYADLKMAPELTAPTAIVDVDAGYHHFVALDEEGRVWAWGKNTDQEVGKTGETKYSFPQRVYGIPDDIVKVSAHNGYLDRGQTFAIDADGNLWSWGSNNSGKHGTGVKTDTSAYQATPHKAIFPAGTVIVDVQGGDYYNVALDSDGNVWVWGYGGNGRLGTGKTASAYAPILLPKPQGMGKALQISVSYDNSLLLDEYNQVWQWGYVYVGPSSGNGKNIKVPVKVEYETSEFARVGYTPIAQSISAGESVSYIVDQYGRSWCWGDNRYFGFGREGGYETNNDIITTKAYQFPQVIGDGDTQIYDKDKKTPDDGIKVSKYGTYGFNTLHPTIYDEKFKDNESSMVTMWKGLALTALPKIDKIYASRSQSFIIDVDGNGFRWGLDGSASIPGGWDFDAKYDTTGNARDGLYDAYFYEIIPADLSVLDATNRDDDTPTIGDVGTDEPETGLPEEEEAGEITLNHYVETDVFTGEYTLYSSETIQVEDGEELNVYDLAKADLAAAGYLFIWTEPEETITVNSDLKALDLYYCKLPILR